MMAVFKPSQTREGNGDSVVPRSTKLFFISYSNVIFNEFFFKLLTSFLMQYECNIAVTYDLKKRGK